MTKVSVSDPQPTLINTTMGEIGVTREGDPRSLAVLCVHGIPGSVRDFRYLAPLLAGDFHVIRVDAPGFGISPRGSVRSVEGWAAVLHAVADALELSSYLLAGHSFGGAAALHAAVSGPERGKVAGLVLLAAPGPRRHRAYFLPQWASRGIARLLSDVPLLRWPLHEFGRFGYRQLGLRSPPDWRSLQHQLEVISTLRFDRLAACARAVCCPTLLCHCVDDPIVDVAIAEESVKGQKIRTLENKVFSKGSYTTFWNGRNNAGKLVGSGLYLCKIITGNKTEAIIKCMLLK